MNEPIQIVDAQPSIEIDASDFEYDDTGEFYFLDQADIDRARMEAGTCPNPLHR